MTAWLESGRAVEGGSNASTRKRKRFYVLVLSR